MVTQVLEAGSTGEPSEGLGGPPDGLDGLFADAGRSRRLQWGVEPMVFEPAPGLRSVLDHSTFQGWVDCSLLHHPVFTVLSEGRPVPFDEVTGAWTIGGDKYRGYADREKLRHWMEGGATLVVSNLHDWHRPAQEFCRALAAATACKVGAVAFWTAAGEEGLHVHRDDGHLFVLQVSGRKRWHLYDVPGSAEEWTPGYVDARQDGRTLDLQAGQVLYLPEGMAHRAVSLDEASLHVTVAVREPRLRDLVRLAVEATLGHVPAHATLGMKTQAREAAAQDLLERVSRALLRVDVPDLVSALERRAVSEAGSW